MKYRVKQIGNWYYPQYKWLWFWKTIQEDRIQENGNYAMSDARCLTLDSAKCKISIHRSSQKIQQTIVVKIWKINE
jgi:hypothetical protein